MPLYDMDVGTVVACICVSLRAKINQWVVYGEGEETLDVDCVMTPIF